MTTSMQPAGQPVWYHSADDDETRWPAIRFPNVWTAYAVCHEQHLQNTTEQEDKEQLRALFEQWALFGLELTCANKHHQPVLLRLQQGSRLDFCLLDDDQVKVQSLYSYMPHDMSPDLKDALQHMHQLMKSPAMTRGIVGTTPNSSTTDEPHTTVTPMPTTTTTGARSTTLRRVSHVPPPQSSLQKKKTSVVQIPPVVEGEPIAPHDAWDTVWKKLDYSGWTRQPSAAGLIYLKPNGRRENDADTFRTLQALQEYCRQAYRWQGPPQEESESSDDESSEEEEEEATAFYDSGEDNSTLPSVATGAVSALTNMTTPHNQRTRPQDPGKPLLGSASSESSEDNDSVDSNSTKAANRYFEKHKEKWNYVKKGMGWQYVREGCTNSSPYQLGKDYFNSVKDLYMYETGRQPREYGRGVRRQAAAAAASKPTSSKKTAKKRRGSTKHKQGSPPRASRTVSTKTSALTQKLEQAASSKKKHKAKEIPKETAEWSRIRVILSAHCGFSLHGRRQVEYKGRVLDELECGFVLLECGIPRAKHMMDTKVQLVQEWLRYLSTKALVNPDFELKAFLRSDNHRLKSALTSLGFSFGVGRIFLPGCPSTSIQQKYGKHYFLQEKLDPFVHYLRCHFTHHVPENPTSDQFEAIRNVRSWMELTPFDDDKKLPIFTSFPRASETEFWDRILHAAHICRGDHLKKKRAPPKRGDDVSVASGNSSSVASSPKNSPFWTEEALRPVLTALGYMPTREGGYTHPKADQSWETFEDLRDFLGKYGVYNYESLKKTVKLSARKALYLWVFGRLVTPEQYFQRESLKLNENQVDHLLCKGGWTREQGRWYHPDHTIENREEGVHMFKSLEGVARQVTLYESALQGKLNDGERLALRLWALTPKRIQLEYKAPAKRRRAKLNLTDVMIPYYKVAKKSKGNEEEPRMHNEELIVRQMPVEEPIGVHDVEVRESMSARRSTPEDMDETAMQEKSEDDVMEEKATIEAHANAGEIESTADDEVKAATTVDKPAGSLPNDYEPTKDENQPVHEKHSGDDSVLTQSEEALNSSQSEVDSDEEDEEEPSKNDAVDAFLGQPLLTQVEEDKDDLASDDESVDSEVQSEENVEGLGVGQALLTQAEPAEGYPSWDNEWFSFK